MANRAVFETHLHTSVRSQGLLTTAEVIEESGASPRQIEYWRRRGWIVPAVQPRGSGSVTGWSPEIVDRARCLADASGFAEKLLAAVAESPGPLVMTGDALTLCLSRREPTGGRSNG